MWEDSGISDALRLCACALQLAYILLDIPEDVEGEKTELGGWWVGAGGLQADQIFSDKQMTLANVDIHLT